eukprot:gene26589-32134_t
MGCGTSAARSSVPSASSSLNHRGGSGVIPQIVSRPLSRPRSYHHGSSITTGELNNMRSEFWSSRVEGNQIIWQSLRSACEALLADDLPLASAILEAASVTIPGGSLELCYDERGFEYKVPHFCFSTPVETTSVPSSISLPIASARVNSGKMGAAAHTPPSSASSARLPAPASGKALRVRVRLNPGDVNLSVDAMMGHSISDLKLLVAEAARHLPNPQDADPARQRIIFMGKEMADRSKLGDVGIDEAKVVQVFMRPPISFRFLILNSTRIFLCDISSAGEHLGV